MASAIPAVTSPVEAVVVVAAAWLSSLSWLAILQANRASIAARAVASVSVWAAVAVGVDVGVLGSVPLPSPCGESPVPMSSPTLLFGVLVTVASPSSTSVMRGLVHALKVPVPVAGIVLPGLGGLLPLPWVLGVDATPSPLLLLLLLRSYNGRLSTITTTELSGPFPGPPVTSLRSSSLSSSGSGSLMSLTGLLPIRTNERAAEHPPAPETQ